VCIAVSNLAQSVLESRLLCLLRTMYYALVLCFAVIALVRGTGLRAYKDTTSCRS
jgi:hypothetical protein